jgi:deoxyribonuclease V
MQRHSWDLTPAQARELQLALRQEVVAQDRLGQVRYVAGIDVGFEDSGRIARAAVVVLRFEDLAVAAETIARRPVTFPYVPGLLSFRETPVVLDALERVAITPDMILYDGHGYAHPRRFGIACHVGLLAHIPTIGVAKSVLVGRHDPAQNERGAWQPLMDGDEQIGAALRTRAGAKPIYVSVGHLISLPTAIEYVLRCTPRYRLPETTRAAHRLASGPERGTPASAENADRLI